MVEFWSPSLSAKAAPAKLLQNEDTYCRADGQHFEQVNVLETQKEPPKAASAPPAADHRLYLGQAYDQEGRCRGGGVRLSKDICHQGNYF